ncbi:MAG: hypothetical protein ACTSWY_13665 [Promethearchaeota archaeon]
MTEMEISNELVKEQEIESFLGTIKENWNSLVAAVVTDEHGFLMGGHLKKELEFNEELLALQAVCDREIIDLKGFYKYFIPCSKGVNLYIVARKNRYNLANYNRLTKIIHNNSIPIFGTT